MVNVLLGWLSREDLAGAGSLNVMYLTLMLLSRLAR